MDQNPKSFYPHSETINPALLHLIDSGKETSGQIAKRSRSPSVEILDGESTPLRRKVLPVNAISTPDETSSFFNLCQATEVTTSSSKAKTDPILGIPSFQEIKASILPSKSAPDSNTNFVLDRPCCIPCAKMLNADLPLCNRAENKGPCNNCSHGITIIGAPSARAAANQCIKIPRRFIPRINQMMRLAYCSAVPPANFEQVLGKLVIDMENHVAVATRVGCEILDNARSVLGELGVVEDVLRAAGEDEEDVGLISGEEMGFQGLVWVRDD